MTAVRHDQHDLHDALGTVQRCPRFPHELTVNEVGNRQAIRPVIERPLGKSEIVGDVEDAAREPRTAIGEIKVIA